jgi:hypothetical protein
VRLAASDHDEAVRITLSRSGYVLGWVLRVHLSVET